MPNEALRFVIDGDEAGETQSGGKSRKDSI